MLMVWPELCWSTSAAGLRSMLPQSRNTSVRSSRLSGAEVTSPSSCRKWYSYGSGNSPSAMNIRQSLPTAVSRCWVATSDPSASPSGFSWVTTISFADPRSPSSAACRPERSIGSTRLPLVIVVILREQFSDPHSTVDRFVVVERERRRVLQSQLGGETLLQIAVRRAQALKAVLATSVVAEDAYVHAGVS